MVNGFGLGMSCHVSLTASGWWGKNVRITPLVWTTLNTEWAMRGARVQWAVRMVLLRTVASGVVLSPRRQLTEVLLMCFVSDYEETELQP